MRKRERATQVLGKAFLSGERPVQRPWGMFEKQQGSQRGPSGQEEEQESQRVSSPPSHHGQLRQLKLREFKGHVLSHPDSKWRAEARVWIPFLCHPSTGHEGPRGDGPCCDLAPSAPA